MASSIHHDGHQHDVDFTSSERLSKRVLHVFHVFPQKRNEVEITIADFKKNLILCGFAHLLFYPGTILIRILNVTN